MREPPKLTPWWIINAFAEGGDPYFSPEDFSSLLSHQLEQWTRQSAVNLGASGGRWWHTDTPDLPPPRTPADIYRQLVAFLGDNYPLRRIEGRAPNISGPIDNTTLMIAVVGDVRDARTRSYLHCLGRVVRMDGHRLFDPIDLKLLALIYLPHNAHLIGESGEIARFLSELHTMMLQPREDAPFDWVQFLQDKNFSPEFPRQSGYDQLSSTQAVELMSQSLFHCMIGEGTALREMSERHSPAYLSMGSVAVYYDWDQHKQELAETASQTLLDRFAHSKVEPYIDKEEAGLAINVIKHRFLTRSLLKELVDLTKSAAAEDEPPAPAPPEPDELRTPQAEAAPEDPFKKIRLLYKEALRLSSIRLERSSGILWDGGWTVQGTEKVIIESVRGVFTGRYQNKARAMEQALLVLQRLEELFEYEQRELPDIPFDDVLPRELLEPFDLDAVSQPPPDTRPPGGGQGMQALALLQVWELLASIPLWIKILAGVLATGSGYLFYRRSARRGREAEKEFAPPVLMPQPRQTSPLEEERQRYREELRRTFRYSVEGIYVQAIKLVQRLEIFIGHVRKNLPEPHGERPPAYQTTTFCRSVFDELIVPGRPSYGRLISNGDFAPPINTGEQLVRFDEFGSNELRRLINQSLNKDPEVAAYLAPQSIRRVDDETQSEELSVQSANKLSTFFYDFASELYNASQQFSIDDALNHVRETRTQDAFVAFAAEAARPPLIFSRGLSQRVPAYVEVKYHNPDLFNEVFAGHFNGQWGNSRKSWERSRNANILSLGVYQPIPLMGDEGRPSLDSIHTVSALGADAFLPAAESPSPSLVFTLGTQASAEGQAPEMRLVSALTGLALPPAPSVVNDVNEFLRQIRRQPLPVPPMLPPLPMLEGPDDDPETPLLSESPNALPRDTYDLMAVARLKGHSPKVPLHLNREYTLQAAMRSVIPAELMRATLPDHVYGESLHFEVAVRAEDMEVGPDWIQPFTFTPGAELRPVAFRLRPAGTGRKRVHVAFLHGRRWLTNIKFEVEVVRGQEPALTI
jgi:hypothetical protein